MEAGKQQERRKMTLQSTKPQRVRDCRAGVSSNNKKPVDNGGVDRIPETTGETNKSNKKQATTATNESVERNDHGVGRTNPQRLQEWRRAGAS
jgi:hypothetical protein